MDSSCVSWNSIVVQRCNMNQGCYSICTMCSVHDKMLVRECSYGGEPNPNLGRMVPQRPHFASEGLEHYSLVHYNAHPVMLTQCYVALQEIDIKCRMVMPSNCMFSIKIDGTG